MKGKFGGKKGDKGKGYSNWNEAYSASKKFNGECSFCHKWGHKKADCRLLAKEKKQKERDSGKGSTNAVSSTSGTGGTTSSPSTNAVYYWFEDEDRCNWADAGEAHDIEDEYQDQRWVNVINEVSSVEQWESSRVKYLLWDSGSDEHLCNRSFGGDLHTVSCNKTLRGISGVSLGRLGRKRVAYRVLGAHGRFLQAETDFLVTDNASKNVLSAGKMRASGFVPNMDDPKNPHLRHPQLDFEVPLVVFNNSFYLKQPCGSSFGAGGMGVCR